MTKKAPRSYIDVKGAAALLGITETAVRRRAQRRQIPFYKPDKKYRFDPEELLEWWAKNHHPAKDQT